MDTPLFQVLHWSDTWSAVHWVGNSVGGPPPRRVCASKNCGDRSEARRRRGGRVYQGCTGYGRDVHMGGVRVVSLLCGSLVPRPPPFFVRFAFSIIHGSGRAWKRALPLPCIILNANRRTKKKRGRPGNKASSVMRTLLMSICLFLNLHVHMYSQERIRMGN